MVSFGRGGFELAGLRSAVVRAFNVLRQYPEQAAVPDCDRMRATLAPRAVIIEGTCDELGRRCSWVLLSAEGPQTLRLAWNPFVVDNPSNLAARLPKALIHPNVAGEAVHELFVAADHCWATAY